MHSTMGRRLPRSLRIYAFGAAARRTAACCGADALAKQSGIPTRNLTLINRHSTYAHNDPAGAFPDNVFFKHLMPFLQDGRPRRTAAGADAGDRLRDAHVAQAVGCPTCAARARSDAVGELDQLPPERLVVGDDLLALPAVRGAGSPPSTISRLGMLRRNGDGSSSVSRCSGA